MSDDFGGEDEWPDDDPGGEWADDAAGADEGLEDSPPELSAEERMQNLLYEAEDEEKENPKRALDLFLKYLGESLSSLAACEASSTMALDLKSSIRRARSSTVRLACRLGEIDIASRELRALAEDFHSAGWEDIECTVLLRLLSDCQALASDAESSSLESLYRLVVSYVPAPATGPAPASGPRRDSLWFCLHADRAKLLLRHQQFAAVRALLEEIRSRSHVTSPQRLQLLALEYSCCKESADAKAASQLLDRAEQLIADKEVVKADVDVHSLALLRADIAERHLSAGRFADAYRHYSRAYLGFYQLDDTSRAIPCLKGAILTQLLTKKKSVFYSHQFKAHAEHKDVQPLAELSDAFELQVDYRYKKVVKELEAALAADPFVAPFLPLLLQLTPTEEPMEEVGSIYRQVDAKATGGLECSVCLDPFGDASHRRNFKDEPQRDSHGRIAFPRAVRLFRCDGHYFHKHCVVEWIAAHETCPVCSRFYGSAGNQPTGSLTLSRTRQSLPGFPDCGTLELNFHFPAGATAEGSAHPAFRKHAYLPANSAGEAAASLLRIALERRLLFKLECAGGSTELVPELPLKATPGAYSDAEGGKQYLEVLTEALQRRGVR